MQSGTIFFQGALESWRGTHRLEFCWQSVPYLRGIDGDHPLIEFQTGPGDDMIAKCLSTSAEQSLLGANK